MTRIDDDEPVLQCTRWWEQQQMPKPATDEHDLACPQHARPGLLRRKA